MGRKKAAKKSERRTVVGTVCKISEIRAYGKNSPDGAGKVQNLDLRVAGPEGVIFTEIALWDTEGLAIMKGLRPSEDLTHWVSYQHHIKLGDRLRVTGPYKLKKWKGDKVGAQTKGSISVYSADQVAKVMLPKLPK